MTSWSAVRVEAVCGASAALAWRVAVFAERSIFSTRPCTNWMRAGKLNNVALGEPVVNEQDLKSFLDVK